MLLTSLFGAAYSYGSFSMYIKEKFYGKWFVLKEIPYVFLPAAAVMAGASLLVFAGAIVYLWKGKGIRLCVGALAAGFTAALVKALTLLATVNSFTPPAWIFSIMCLVSLIALYHVRESAV